MRVLIADGVPMFRAGVRSVVAEFDMAAEIIEAETAEELQALVRHRPLDLVLTSLNLPTDRDDVPADTVLSAIAFLPDDVRVVVVDGTAARSDILIQRAVDAGALGHLSRDADRRTILDVLQAVMAGKSHLPAALSTADHVAGRTATPCPAAPTRITQAQRAVLNDLATGARNKDIAQRLGLAEATVKVHVAAILRALNVHSRAQAIIAARELGLLQPSDGGDVST